MTDLYIKGLASGNVSIAGDGGLPSVNVSTNETETVASADVVGNKRFCDDCATFIDAGKIEVRIGSATGRVLTASEMESVKGGTLFDLNADGVADQAEKGFGAVAAGIDATAVAATVTKLGGDGSGKFLPKSVIALCEDADTATVQATISIGNTDGGTDIMAATALTGVLAAGQMLLIDVTPAAVFAGIDDDSDIYINVTVGATATSQTLKVALEGSVL